ncbi:GNAT family N-acetyltransferase [Deinococcus altitudinis]|uniref:GNAT family N-acetyltransferase n=1 Tax=Deinococcus altitudinis TaxID=468914 RepID=UPI00389191C4
MSFELSSERLILRPLRPGDAPALAAYRSDPAVARYQGWVLPYSVQDAGQLIAEMAGRVPGDRVSESGGWVQIGLESRAEGVLLGDVALNTSGRQAEIGVTLTAQAQGRGYAAEALRALISHAFGSLKLEQVRAEIDPRNVAALRLLLTLGFRHTATEYGGYLNRGEWTDNAVYTVTEEEWLT